MIVETEYTTHFAQEQPQKWKFEGLLGRLWRLLCTRAEVQRTFHISHRALSKVLGCSAGALPPLMRLLEACNAIVREPIANTFLITVCDRAISALSEHQEREKAKRSIDQRRSIANDRVINHVPGDSDAIHRAGSAGSIDQRSASRDRVINRVPGDSDAIHRARSIDHRSYHDHDQHQHQQDHAARDFLRTRPHAVYPQAWRKILQARPDYTVQDWERDLTTISTRRDLRPEQWIGTLVLILQSPDEQVLGQTDIDAATAERTAQYNAPGADQPASSGPPSKREPPASQRRNRSRSGPPTEHLYQPIIVEDIRALQAEREQRALKLCPGATHDELIELCIAFDAGLDDAAALAALQTAREAGYV